MKTKFARAAPTRIGLLNRVTDSRTESSLVNTGDLPTTRVSSTVSSDPASLVAFTLYVKVPVAVGVPERTPVDEFNVIPAGSAPALTVYTLRYPLATNV
ncbi:unannotated protein [freshwater metagenome]|uniref:Unannotated protein n=1 Tax=freshwater metagenome TaxID=449393 RepID=A0A6J6MYW5_9ZZZZ